MDRFTSKQDLSVHRPILHISSYTIHHQDCFVCVIFVCMSVCLSHSHTPHIFRSLNTGMWSTVYIFEEVTPCASEWWCNSKIKRSIVKVTGNENVKIVSSRISWCKVVQFTSNSLQVTISPSSTFCHGNACFRYFFLFIIFCQWLITEPPLFNLSILLHDCQKLEVVAEIFPLAPKFLIGVLLKRSLNLGCKSHVVDILATL